MISEKNNIKKIKRAAACVLAGALTVTLLVPGVFAEAEGDQVDVDSGSVEAVLMDGEEESGGGESVTASNSAKLTAWNEDGSNNSYDSSKNLYGVGKYFYTELVVSGDNFSALSADLVYDSSVLIYNDEKTQAYSKNQSDSEKSMTISADSSEAGRIHVLRSGNEVTVGKNGTAVVRIFFTAVSAGRTAVELENVKIGTTEPSSVAEKDLTEANLDITKVYAEVDPVIGTGAGDLVYDSKADTYSVDPEGSFAVNVRVIGTSFNAASLIVKYDAEKLVFDSESTAAGLAEGCTAAEAGSGSIAVMRNSNGMKSGQIIATLYFKAASSASGDAAITLSGALVGTDENAQTTLESDDMSGCVINIVKPETEEVTVTLVSYLDTASSEISKLVAGENKISSGEFTFTVKSAIRPVAVTTTDGGATYTKIVPTASDNGSYTYTATAVEGLQIEVAMLGDVNLDGKVRLTDINAIRSYLNDTGTLEGLVFYVADVTEDARVSLTDINEIRNYLNDEIGNL